MAETRDHTYLVVRMNQKIMSFLFSGTRPIEIHADAATQESLLGNIYIGRIQNIAKNIGAAFVEIAPGKICYLPLSEIRNPIYTKKGSSPKPQQGDELVVQVVREAIKTKAPAVSTNLTLHGKYMLLTTGNTSRSVSSKIGPEERQRLLQILKQEESCKEFTESPGDEQRSEAEQPNSYGWLIRTNAAGVTAETLQKDMARLTAQYEQLGSVAPHRTCYSCLYSNPASYLARLSDLYSIEVDKITTDDPELFGQMQEYLRLYQPEDLPKLIFYEDPLLPLLKLYSLEHHLQEALQERVWLKSGGYLVIQPTEALTVIDVNTGKYEGGKKKEAAFLKINQEAAVEIARQLRLRNLSGIIIVDFINMEEKASNEALLSLLNDELRRDPIRTVLVEMTKLSLVEITRQKRERPLFECIWSKV